MKKLGFGCMRLPRLSDGTIDHEQFKRMIDAFIERGFTYFDTAYMYHDGMSEYAVRDDLVARHNRQEFTLADKLPTMRLTCADDMQRIFDEQRKKTGVDYFDYYLLHNLNDRLFGNAVNFGAFEFIKRKKEEGSVKNIGFSFHAKADLLEKILTDYPFFDFVQLQINYLDWESTSVQSKKCYEVARKHNIPIVIMEPVKGGSLAKIPGEAEKLMKAYNKDASAASWAVRYAAGLEGVMTVLSGMSDMGQLDDNTSYMADFKPLCDKEKEIIEKVRTILYASIAIPCTGCSYCTEGCPQQIAIPKLFSLYNDMLAYEKRDEPDPWGDKKEDVPMPDLNRYKESASPASSCIACGQCEGECPQNLPVIELLRSVADKFEN